jgi:hypothetical protein
MCDVLLPPGVNPTAVKYTVYIYIYHIIYKECVTAYAVVCQRETGRLVPLLHAAGAGAVAPTAAVSSLFEKRSHSCLGRDSSFPATSLLCVCRLRTEPRVHHARTHMSNLFREDLLVAVSGSVPK